MPKILSSFRTKVTLALVLSMFFVIALSNFLVYRFTLDSQFSQLRDKLMIIAQTASLMVDADLLQQVPLNQQGIYSPQYKAIAQNLKKIKAVNPLLKYIYILSQTDKAGVWQFMVDPEPVVKKGKTGVLTSYPGDKYDASGSPEMINALRGAAADKKITVDEWGAVVSGYAPVRDKNNQAVAILGVDMSAADVYQMQKEVKRRSFLVLGLGILLSFILGLFISRRITGPIRKLVEGTRRIAADDLQYKVEIKGDDEISELGRSFNQMAKSLFESRKKLHNYFYNVVQSLIRILEAKDAYTKGHSDRVAEYSEKIARQMGYSPEKIELIKNSAELHDIGKLGIQENILNKNTKLSDEEWKTIQAHPALGEEILKPVSLDDDMLAVIKSHHERYDGKGYPEHIEDGQINIFAQIISVADAYDAMTSSRAYRPAMQKDAAVAELKKNSGTQFNSKVVEAFLEVLQEEGIQK